MSPLNESRQFAQKSVDSLPSRWVISLLQAIRYFVSLLGQELRHLLAKRHSLDECGGVHKAIHGSS
jgi:hypothetical protein